MTSSSGATRPTLRSATATLAICLTVPAHGQEIIARPEPLSGSWEIADTSGVHGILVMISQSTSDGLTRQTVQVRLYHRKDGRGTWQWYVVAPPRDGAGQFDGHRLIVAGLTATFDPETVRWIGEWVLDGHSRLVVLERPHPANVVPLNSLCGDWEASSERPPTQSIRIHIAQSVDGALTAWMDRDQVMTQRVQSHYYGRSMKVISLDPKSIILENEAPNSQFFGRFTGALSSDGNTIAAQWNGRPAPWIFRRIR